MSRITKLGSRFKQLLSPKPALTPTSVEASKQLTTGQQSKSATPAQIVQKELKATDLAKALTRPDLYVVRLLMKNGAMTSDQIWSTYQRELKASKKNAQAAFTEYFTSKNHLKQKTLAEMRKFQRIKSKGFDHQTREHLGWELTPKAMRNLKSPIKKYMQAETKKAVEEAL